VWSGLDNVNAYFYRDMTYRDMAKRGGHGTNYYGTAKTMAMHLKVETALIAAFQEAYFGAFPEIQEWQLEVIAQIQSTGRIVTPLGRERQFWGRPDDPVTHRAAIAHGPQSLVADIMNEGLMQVQEYLIKECDYAAIMANNDAGLIAQVHDAGAFLIPLDGAPEILESILQHIVFPVDFGSQGVMAIPAEMSVGLNWGKEKRNNPAGLRAWKPGDGILLGA
jgi:DNA polymerase I-like protein with 3'-5' exonuclease and polymerase domains